MKPNTTTVLSGAAADILRTIKIAQCTTLQHAYMVDGAPANFQEEETARKLGKFLAQQYDDESVIETEARNHAHSGDREVTMRAVILSPEALAQLAAKLFRAGQEAGL